MKLKKIGIIVLTVAMVAASTAMVFAEENTKEIKATKLIEIAVAGVSAAECTQATETTEAIMQDLENIEGEIVAMECTASIEATEAILQEIEDAGEEAAMKCIALTEIKKGEMPLTKLVSFFKSINK